MRRDYFTFGDICSLDFGVWLTNAHTENVPEREMTTYAVPGRSGNLLADQKRWKNVYVTYNTAIVNEFMANFDGLKAGLLSQPGYQRLEDSIRPDVYRVAAFHSEITPENTRYNRAGQFDLVFDCKPQRFLKSGEHTMNLDSPTTLYNPTGFPALPLIVVYGSGSGTVTVGDAVVEIVTIENQITLDSDLQHAYRQLGEGAPENMNGCISAPAFPKLLAGENPVSWSGDIERLEIIPRWWKL